MMETNWRPVKTSKWLFDINDSCSCASPNHSMIHNISSSVLVPSSFPIPIQVGLRQRNQWTWPLISCGAQGKVLGVFVSQEGMCSKTLFIGELRRMSDGCKEQHHDLRHMMRSLQKLKVINGIPTKRLQQRHGIRLRLKNRRNKHTPYGRDENTKNAMTFRLLVISQPIISQSPVAAWRMTDGRTNILYFIFAAIWREFFCLRAVLNGCGSCGPALICRREDFFFQYLSKIRLHSPLKWH